MAIQPGISVGWQCYAAIAVGALQSDLRATKNCEYADAECLGQCALPRSTRWYQREMTIA